MSEKPKCKFYNEVYCEPCRSPTDFEECVLVKIGNQIIVDKFVESIPESKKSEYVSLGFYLNNLKNQREELIKGFIKDINESIFENLVDKINLRNKWQGRK